MVRQDSSRKRQAPFSYRIQTQWICFGYEKIITTINNIRFDLDEQIRTLDLTKRENLSLVYDKLEEGVKLYKEFYTKQRILESDVEAYYKTLKFTADEMQFPEVLVAMQNVYSSFRTGLNALYFKDDDNFGELIRNQEDALAKLNNVKLADYNSTRLINSKVQTYWGISESSLVRPSLHKSIC